MKVRHSKRGSEDMGMILSEIDMFDDSEYYDDTDLEDFDLDIEEIDLDLNDMEIDFDSEY